ncbi:facilitated trehalose transporter Tret1-like [Onthophagus taurus]|uniref:facilitated trehalose transporter Tret1-like n=1 Tax=Onthophagus taurus TaxID=166361 RepID=UPI000C20C571|nr:facilitated trehalose transporter Tret1-like [Onthophagus taurus]
MSVNNQYTPVQTTVDNTQEEDDIGEDVAKKSVSDTMGAEETCGSDSSNSKTFLYLTACIANLASFTCGIALGWTSPVLPQLSGNFTVLPEPLTTDQSSWIGSLLPVGASLGPFLAGYLADKLGRKKTILISTAPFLVAFILFGLASSVYEFYIGRFLCGVGSGGLFTVLPMYMGEIAEDSVRGALGSLMQLFITLGILFSFSIGPYTTISVFSMVCVIIPSIFFVVFIVFSPDSPYFLISVNKNNEAETALMKLRSKKNVTKELEVMIGNIAESKASNATFMDIFKTNVLRKALILSVGLVAFQQLSGINVILFYTETIFDATGSSIPSDISTILVGLVQVSFSGITPLLVDRKGKRFLLIFSGIGMALSQFALGYYFQRIETKLSTDSIFWLPVLCLILYNATYCMGFGPLPWAVMGELFPPNVKSAASTVTASGCWILAFVITRYFKNVSDLVGIGISFYMFGGFCIIAATFVYKLLPETSGKSLNEVQALLEGKAK